MNQYRCETCKKRLYENPEDCPCEKDYEQLLEHRVSVSDIELIMSISGCASHSEFLSLYDEDGEPVFCVCGLTKEQCAEKDEWIKQDERKRVLDTLIGISDTKLEDFLEWLADRLIFVYNENPNTDFVLSLRHRANVARKLRQEGNQDEKKCYDGTQCVDGKSDACNICSIPLQKGEKIECKLHTICKYVTEDCFTFNPDHRCDLDTRNLWSKGKVNNCEI